MPVLEKNDEEKRVAVYEFLKNSKFSNLHQSVEWANVKSDKWKQEIVYIEENDVIKAAMVLLVRKVGLYAMMYAPRGPVCDINDIDLINELVNNCNCIAKKYKAFVLKMDPEIKYNKQLEKKYKKKYKVKNKVNDILELMAPIKSMVLPIEGKNVYQVFNGFKSKTKYNIRLANRKGVKVRFSNSDEDLKKFYDLMIITGKRDKIAIRSYQYYKNIVDYFGINARIYIAEYNNEPLSAAITILHGKTVTYLYGASSNEKRNLMPNYLMQFNMIEWAINNECTKYDFGGVFNTTMDNGLYRFKEGFCGEEGCITYIGEIDKVYKKLYYIIYNKAFPIVEHIILKKIKK